MSDDLVERRMIYADNSEDAPSEVWIEWSAVYDAVGPHDYALEDDWIEKPDRLHMPVQYVRADRIAALEAEVARLREALEGA